MDDPVMLFSGMLFLLLFAVLGFIFLVTVAAMLKRRRFLQVYEPHASVIIPVYNEKKNIGRCLEAIRENAYPKEKIEVLIVDDGSTDGTLSVAEKFSGVRILRQQHKGKVEALNLGLKEAISDIVITIDADVMIENDFIKNIVRPFSDPKVGAVSGAAKVADADNMLSAYQAIEYVYNSLIMDSFSRVFGTSFWFWGALASFRKDVLLRVGGFSKSTETEDFDIIMNIKKAGYKTLSIGNAVGRTHVPDGFAPLFRQRMRWWKGTLQTLKKNKEMFRPRYGIVIMFLFFTQLFWIFYSFLAIPVISYQIVYWLPYNMANAFDTFFYLFRWFNLVGPFYALYMIPQWGVSVSSIFGILSGVITVLMITFSFVVFRERMSVRKLIGVFFYFPFTLLMNLMIVAGAVEYALNRGKGTFIK
jgi:cellulose synthase/poly-beta-1,6-N-acetylglucosamine synthase-like glycosyltransferase